MICKVKWPLLAAAIWGLWGCSTADLNEFADAMYCFNAYPDDEYAQHQYANMQAESRQIDWCNGHIGAYNDALAYLQETVPSFIKRYREQDARLERYADNYSKSCFFEVQRRANPEVCGVTRLINERNTVVGLERELAGILEYDRRAASAARSFNQNCLEYAVDGAIGFESSAEYFEHYQDGLTHWLEALSSAIEGAQ